MTPELQFGLLGNLQVLRAGAAVPVTRSKLRVLLATLLLEPNRTVPFEAIIGRLWGDDPPPSARSSTHVYAMRLRRALDDSRPGFQIVQTRSNGYLLEVEPDQVDISRFHDLLGRARRAGAAGDLARESDLLGDAIRLWRGPALLDIPSVSLHRSVVPRLTEERFQAVERRLEIGLALGRHSELVGELTELTREHPTRERLWLLLMQALLQLDRQAEVLDTYRTLWRMFHDELGIEPGEAIQRLHRAVLAGDHHRDTSGSHQRGRVTPCHLPPDVPVFAGRAEQVEQLSRELSAGSGLAMPVLILSGLPGVGKTALAVHVAHRVRASYPDGQLYVNLQGYSPGPPLTSDVVLARLLRALGVPAHQVPTDQDDQVTLYRSLLAGRRVLVVLDNAAGPSQVRPLLPGQPGCGALVTSRDDLRGLVAIDGGLRVSLVPLDPAGSRNVLVALIGATRVGAEREALDDLAALCGGLPLALRIAGANLQSNRHLRIADHVTALRTRGRLVHLQVRNDPQAAVMAAFDISYARLSPPVARLFRLLAAVPGPDFAAPAVAALLGCTAQEADQHLDALLAANLVFPSGAGRFALHDLIREYATTRAAADEDFEPAARRLWDFYLHTARTADDLLYPDVAGLPLSAPVSGAEPLALSTGEAALAWLDSERANLVAAVLSADERGRRPYAWRLADALRGYFWVRGNAIEGLAVCEAALAAARRDGDRRAAATVLDMTGLIHFTLSRYDTARAYHARALELSRLTGDLERQASSLYHLGRVSVRIGPVERSMRYHREALVLAGRTGNQDAQALNTNYLGVAQLAAGHVDLALRSHLRALRLSRRTGNQSVRVRVTGALANLAWYRGELAVAIALYLESLELARRLGNRCLEANSLVCLAEARCDAGDYAQAISDAEAFPLLGREIGDRHHEVGGREVVTTCRFRSGRTDGVVDDYQDALDLAREINFRFGEASILRSLAAAHRAAGDPAGAVAHARRALRTMHASGVRGMEAHALIELGHGWLELGEPSRAAGHIDGALALVRRAGLRLTEARALHVHGLIQWAERAPDAARESWQTAMDILSRVGAPETDTVRALLAAAPGTSATPDTT